MSEVSISNNRKPRIAMLVTEYAIVVATSVEDLDINLIREKCESAYNCKLKLGSEYHHEHLHLYILDLIE